MNLGQLLDTVEYGTRVRLVHYKSTYNSDEYITTFVMSDTLEYTKAYELVEPHIEKEVIIVYVTADGKLCVEIL
ncbi:hypothetical protein QOFMPA_00094 [Enterococcus phage vB_OCPT_Toy]|nr:hypothetical protein QOFMPA_00094 [Enterococcus phage vB_OCPT_Toy]